MTHWHAPFSSGEHKFLPAGLEFVVIDDPPGSAKAIGAKPDSYVRWEALLIDGEDRKAKKYTGYSLVIPLVHLAKRCARR